MSKVQSLIEIFNQNGLHGEEAVQKAIAIVNEEERYREERERYREEREREREERERESDERRREEREEREERERACELVYSFFHPGLIL